LKILIAGGAGYIGCVLVPKLLERGYDLDVIDLLWFGNNLPPEVNLIRKDLMELTREELVQYQTVIFLAGLSNDPMAEYSPAENFVDNAAGPAYLAFLAKSAGVQRFIHGGSCSVYGYTVNELYDEESPAVSNYPYGISKLQGEFGALKLVDDGFSVIAIRKGTVCGYSPRMRLDLVVNTMFFHGLTRGLITINNATIWRPILSVQDAATAYIRAIEAPASISGIFNVASGNYTVGEIGDLVKEGLKTYLGVNPQLKVEQIKDFRNYKVSIEKAKNVLSYKPRFGVEDIVKDLADNYSKFKDVDNSAYFNIQTFKMLNRWRPGGRETP
jgi:nucleoside-diphosphate-sugar epimerase